jgi:hypothetical protein
MGAQWYDGNISLPGCDKNMPGTLIAMARLNRPAIMIYGGTIKPGYSKCVACVCCVWCLGAVMCATGADCDAFAPAGSALDVPHHTTPHLTSPACTTPDGRLPS